MLGNVIAQGRKVAQAQATYRVVQRTTPLA